MKRFLYAHLIALLLIAVIFTAVSCDDNDDKPDDDRLPPVSGGVDDDVELVSAMLAGTETELEGVIDLGIDGAENFIFVYNKAPAGAYLVIEESLEDEITAPVTVKGSMGGFSVKYGGYLVAYSVNLGYSAADSRSFTCIPYFTDSKGNTEAIGDVMTFTRGPTFAGVGVGTKIDQHDSVIVESGKSTEVTVFTYGYCKDIQLTLSTKRAGVVPVKLTPTSNEYNEELGYYLVVFTVPALEYDDDDGAINRYTLIAAPTSSSAAVQSYRIQIRDPHPNIDEDGWRPI